MTKKKKPDTIPHTFTAKVSHRTLDRLVTLAARVADTSADPYVFDQVRFRLVDGQLEARATDRYTIGFILADLDNGQAWPDGLDLGLTVRQWRTILATLRPARGTSHHRALHTFDVAYDPDRNDGTGTVTVSRGTAQHLGDTVNSLTFPLPAGAYPNLDGLRRINPDAVTPTPPVALDGKLLARLPREFGLLVAENTTDTAKARVVHVVAESWHVAIMSARLADDWGNQRPAATIPAQWAEKKETP